MRSKQEGQVEGYQTVPDESLCWLEQGCWLHNDKNVCIHEMYLWENLKGLLMIDNKWAEIETEKSKISLKNINRKAGLSRDWKSTH